MPYTYPTLHFVRVIERHVVRRPETTVGEKTG